MDAKELMIGDWVLLNGEPKQVMETLFGSITIDCYPIEECYVEPIPLTPEILEKNGFEIYEQDFTSNTVYEFGSLDYMEYEEYHKYFNVGCKITYKHFGREIIYIHSLMHIQYVHELQHALKLCGIEKNIEL